MAGVNHFNNTKRKNGLDIDLKRLLDDSEDDHIPDLLIVPSEKSKAAGRTGEEDADYRRKTDNELNVTISRCRRNISNLGPKCNDNGEKFKVTIRRCEAELERRSRNHGDKDGVKHEETMLPSDQSDDGVLCRENSSAFAYLFAKKIDKNERTVNAFEKEMSFINPRLERKTNQNAQLLNRGRSSQQSSSRLTQFQSPTTLFDKKVNRSSISSHHFYQNNQPTTKLKPKVPSLYNLVDDDIEDPDDSNTTIYPENLSECMKDVKVYYPSREDRDPVEVIYTDMECLAPEACLSSTIMNFYIRYLQQSSSENRGCNYHFFNTYFYHKLQKLNYREDSFLKFRKWWKGVNIFEKAYILLPVHQSAHWSLAIICIPTKKDELGPIVLHLDSLGLHDSSLIFDNVGRFVKEEFNHLRNLEDPLDLPIMDEIWENLDRRIIHRKIQVPQQRNSYDCGLFVLYYMECFIKEAPERLKEKDLSMFGKQWFLPKEASNLRWRIHNLLVQEFKMAKDKETILSS